MENEQTTHSESNFDRSVRLRCTKIRLRVKGSSLITNSCTEIVKFSLNDCCEFNLITDKALDVTWLYIYAKVIISVVVISRTLYKYTTLVNYIHSIVVSCGQ